VVVVVVMDNLLRAHKGDTRVMEELIEARGALLVFLPPLTSPEFSPIEEAFSKIKALR
jgi:transposase